MFHDRTDLFIAPPLRAGRPYKAGYNVIPLYQPAQRLKLDQRQRDETEKINTKLYLQGRT